MNKLPTKYTPVATSFWMACTLSLLMSGVITFINTGLAQGFISRWMHAWVIAFPVAFFVAYTLRPVVLKLVSLTVQSPTAAAPSSPAK
jgi:uncharacterized membrane protein required for colicin V production